MAKRMLIDAAHPEETRIALLNGHRLEDYDFEAASKRQIKGNIYLAKVTRVEPSLQAAFVEYGGNRHGFLAFNEIHPDYYRIPVGDREAFEERERRHQADVPARDEAEEPPPVEQPDHDYESTDESEPAGEGDESRAEPAEALPASQLNDDVIYDTLTPDTAEREIAAVATSALPVPEAQAPAVEPADAPHETVATEGEAPPPANQNPDSGPPEASLEIASPSEHAETQFADSSGVDTVERPGAETIETLGGDDVDDEQPRRQYRHRHYKIQEVIKRRQIMLVQVTKEERGNKGAALTTYLSLAGRYCVLMPNTPRAGGVSRKITSAADRRRLKDLMGDLEVPDGMGVIVRTAGSERSKVEIKRDFEYLMRLWDEIRELTLKSTAPALVYEEGNLIKRSIRDLYTRDLEEVVVDGADGYRAAKDFMKMVMPSHAKRVKLYADPTVPLFHRYQVESQIDAIHSPNVQLRSGGYIVINPTEALVAIDVNSGRATRERNIEETALRTNVEAAEEIARQLRLRDLAGLIVIDFIDMEEGRNAIQVERRLKDAMRHDRARIQIGRISPFGLLELSRQRLRPSLLEASTEPCPHCGGTGHLRSTELTALHILRAIEEEGMRRRSAEITVTVPTAVALAILNHQREALVRAEQRYGLHVAIGRDDTLIPPAFRLDRGRALTPEEIAALPPPPAPLPVEDEDDNIPDEEDAELEGAAALPDEVEGPAELVAEIQGDAALEAPLPSERDGHDSRRSRGRGRSRRGRGRSDDRHRQPHRDQRSEPQRAPAPAEPPAEMNVADAAPAEGVPGNGEPHAPSPQDGDQRKRRRRGRRGGRRRRRGDHPADQAQAGAPMHAAATGEDHGPVADEPHREPEAREEPPHRESEQPVHREPAHEPREERVPEHAAAEPARQPEPEPPPAAPEPPAGPPRRGWWRR